jgi:hypothetical protein
VIAVNFTFRNVGAGPIKFRVEDLRLILDARTADHPDNIGKEVIIPRAAGKGYRSAAIPWDKSKNPLKGSADITLLYGHPEIGGYVRKFRMKLEIGMVVTDGLPTAFNAGIVSESDSPYQATTNPPV